MISCTKKTPRHTNFPKLMINKRQKDIVLMLSIGKGVRVGMAGSSAVYSELWIMEEFEDYQGAIILENEK